MSWKLDLSSRPIHSLQIVDAAPRQLAVWLDAATVHFYAVENGALYGSLVIDSPGAFDPYSLAWREFVAGLRVPHGDFLPWVALGDVTVLTSYDGRLRLYIDRAHRLVLESEGLLEDLPCDDDAPILAAGLDRDLGTVAALSAAEQLHLYQQHVYVGQYALSDVPQTGLHAVYAPDAGGEAIVVFESGVRIVDLSGRVQYHTETSALIGSAACAPAGNLVVLGERDRALVRVYDSELRPLHQGSAHALLGAAHALQLMTREATPEASFDGLAVDNDGVLAFALDGVVCCSHVDLLPGLPYPNELL